MTPLMRSHVRKHRNHGIIANFSEVLVDLLDKFPSYYLMSEKGVEEGIHNI
jgi:hypothetical protein